MSRVFFQPCMDDAVHLPLLQSLRVWHKNFSSFSGVADGSGAVFITPVAIYIISNVGPFDSRMELTGQDAQDMLSGQFDLPDTEEIFLPDEASELERAITRAKAEKGYITIGSGMSKILDMLPESTSVTVYAGEEAALLHAVRGREQFLLTFTAGSAYHE